MIVKTKAGVDVNIDPNVLDDMRFVDALVKLQEGDLFAMSAVASKLFGDQKEEIYKSIETEDGRVLVETFMAEVIALFNTIGENGKKS